MSYFDNQSSIKIGDSLEKIYAAFEAEEKEVLFR